MIKYPFFCHIFGSVVEPQGNSTQSVAMSLCESHEKDMKMDKTRGAIFKCLEEIGRPQAYSEARCAHLCLSPKQINV